MSVGSKIVEILNRNVEFLFPYTTYPAQTIPVDFLDYNKKTLTEYQILLCKRANKCIISIWDALFHPYALIQTHANKSLEY